MMESYSAAEGLNKLIEQTKSIIEMKRHEAKRSREYADEEESSAVVLERTLSDLREIRLSTFGEPRKESDR